MFALRLWRWLAILVWVTSAAALAQDDGDQHQAVQLAQRFQSVLEKNPRRGTAFDRVYGHHIEWGTLEKFATELRERTKKTPSDSSAWMILGLVESQRGRDALAVEAFMQAEQAPPPNAIASFYLGQALILSGRPDQAVAAFERAIERQPPPTDLLEVFQALGRLHQRAQRHTEARAVWERLEKLFPNDARIYEQIAITLVEEGQFAAALPRYEQLVALTKDDYRRTVFRQEAAELKARLGKSTEAVADLESMLGKLNPDSWLHREVRRRIEDIFLRSDDQAGLAKYYERWLAQHAQDVDAMARLARVLARQGRLPDAQPWLEKALKLAPTRRDLRLGFIEQLVEDAKFAEALAQYAELDRAEPNNPDVLREWGKLILRDTKRPEADRKAEAEKVWRRLVAARPTYPLVATQVADLLRHANMTDAALELYRRAVELSPTQPQYREYLGEYLHLLKRDQEALETWRAIAAGPQRTATNTARLAEVLAGFGYLKEALPEISAACELDAKDFALRLKASGLFAKAEQFPPALEHLAAAEKLATNDDEREIILAQRLKLYEADGSLAERAQKLAEAVQATDKPTLLDLLLLARLREAQREFAVAVGAIKQALKIDGQSLPALTAVARLYEQTGDLQAAADTSRQLANVDRRSRTVHLTSVSRLESQLGHADAALQAGRDLIAAAPGNAENHSYFAQLCFRLGKPDEGLETLRRAVRANPADTQLLTELAQQLAGLFRTDEAIELYWQAFDRTKELDSKLAAVTKLTELYLQTNRLDKLLERLERSRREFEVRRELTLCLAQAFLAAGDFGEARKELEGLLTDDTRDTLLLQQLSKLSEDEGDLQAAAKFQEQVARLAPGPESEYRLANLLERTGAAAESKEILTRLALREEDPIRLLRSLDTMLGARALDTALPILEAKLRESPKDWELLYRQGVVLAADKPDEARRIFQAIRDLPLTDDSPGVALVDQLKKSAVGSTAHSTASTVAGTSQPAIQNPQNTISQIRQVLQLDSRLDPFGGVSRQPMFWVPRAFGEARLAALGWQFKLAGQAGAKEAFLANHQSAADHPDAKPRALWDAHLLKSLTNNGRNDLQLLLDLYRRLARTGDLDASLTFLRIVGQTRELHRQSAITGRNFAAGTPTLTQADLELAMACHDRMDNKLLEPTLSLELMDWLKEEGRTADANRIEKSQEKRMTASLKASMELGLAMRDSDAQRIVAAVKSWSKALAEDAAKSGSTQTATQQIVHSSTMSRLPQLIGQLGPQKAHAEILQLVDMGIDLTALQRTQPPTASPARRAANVFAPAAFGMSVNYGQQTSATNATSSASLGMSLDRVLINARHVFKKNEAIPEFIQHLEQRVERATSAADKSWEMQVLGAVHGWEGNLELAGELMAKAMAAAPHDTPLRLAVANLHIANQRFDEALTLLDGYQPQNPADLQRRETQVLDLAIRLGQIDRAKQAAERLFGTRMSAAEQITLAERMRRLGLNEMADAVLARSMQQAGNQTSTLAALMAQYQAAGKADLAAQVAHQILRRSPRGNTTVMPGMPSSMSSNTASTVNAPRRAALQFLGQSGQLLELISRAETQLKAAPKSTVLLETLVEYYAAAGQIEKSAALEKQLLDLTPDTAQRRYALAQQLASSRKFSEACDQYLLAIRKEPRLLGGNYYQIPQTFQQANREADLYKLLNEIDLKAIGNSTIVTNIVSQQAVRNKDLAAVTALFRRAWETFPDERANLVTRVQTPAFWQQTGMSELLRQSLFETSAAGQRDPWHGLQANSYSQGGQINGLLDILLSGNKDPAALGKLRDDVAAAAVKQPEWRGCKLLLVVLDARLGKVADARSAIDADWKDLKDVPGSVARTVAQNLESHAELRDFCVRLYEHSLTDANGVNDQFEFSARPKLVSLYVKSGRQEEAKQILRAALQAPPRDQGDPDYAVYQRMQSMQQVANSFVAMNAPLEAVQAIRQMNAVMNLPQAKSSRFLASNGLYSSQQAKTTEKLAMTQLRTKPFHELVAALIPAADTDGTRGPLDLFLNVDNNAGAKGIQSLVLELLRGEKIGAAERGIIAQRLAERLKQIPDDLNVQVLAVCFAVESSEAAAQQTAIAGLLALVEKSPLEAIADGQRPSTNQRAEAERQLGLWLAARDCLGQDKLQAEGKQLADRALAAAARQSDNRFHVAMLTEWAGLAGQRNDSKLAQEKWEQLLGVLLASATSSKSASAAPLTETQFNAVMNVALATAKEAPPVSFQAVRRALAGGPPISESSSVPSQAGMVVIWSSANRTTMVNLDTNVKVTTALANVAVRWTTNDVSTDGMYAALHAVAFPPGRPNDIFLYESPVNNNSAIRHVGHWLIPAAERAGKSADLLSQLTELRKNPNAEVAALVLLAQLHFATGDREAVKQDLATLGELVNRKNSPSVTNLACHAVHSLRLDREFLVAAAPIVEVATSTINASIKSVSGQSIQTMTRLSLQHAMAMGNVSAVKQKLEADHQQRLTSAGQHSGSYAHDYQRQQTAETALFAARSGYWSLGWDYLGKALDFPDTGYSSLPFAAPLWHLERQLRALPAAEQFELLRDWTMPTATRRSVRSAVGFAPAIDVPTDILMTMPSSTALQQKYHRTAAQHVAPPFVPLANLDWLVAAAKEAGTLAELRAAAEAAVKEKLPNAPQLLVLTLIATADWPAVEPVLSEIMAVAKKRQAETINDRRVPVTDADFLVARACLYTPQLRTTGLTFGTRLLEHARWSYNNALITHLGLELSLASVTGSATEPPANVWRDAGLRHWIPYDSRSGSGQMPAAWWAAHDGYVAHRTGHTHDALGLRYPLIGSFEFSFASYADHFATGEVGFGGIVCAPEPWSDRLAVWPWSRRDELSLPKVPEVFAGGIRRMTVQFADGKTRFLLNGRLAYEDDAGRSTSPWLELHVLNHRKTAFWNARLTGVPTIPREVRLVADGRIDGWFSPSPLSMPKRWQASQGNPDTRAPGQLKNSWTAAESTLTGHIANPEDVGAGGALVSYRRPLQSGETIRYQFFHDRRQSAAAPAIGSLVFLLDSTGVTVHWQPTDAGMGTLLGSDESMGGPMDVPLVRPASTTALTSLKAGDWNQMDITLRGDVVTLRLNDQPLCEVTLPEANSRQFGVFHRTSEAKVRDIVLTGDWPQRLTEADMADPFAVARPAVDRAEGHRRHALIDETFYVKDVFGVGQAARQLPPAERLAFLKAWVLPSDTHPTIRLQAAFTPVDPSGGEFVAPAVELVRVATELGKLEELAKTINAEPASRSQRALRLLVAIAREDDGAAETLMKEIVVTAAAIPAGTSADDRFPEVVAVWESLARPTLRATALKLAEQLVANHEKDGSHLPAFWEPMVRHLRDRARD